MDDSITDAILGDGYQRLRVEHRVYLRYPLPQKTAWQSYMHLSIAAIYPLAALLPAGVREQHLPVVAEGYVPRPRRPRLRTVAALTAQST